MIIFSVPGTPVAKGRPRAFNSPTGIRMHTPAKTERYEARVALFASQAMAGREPLLGPVSLQIKAVFAMPKSWSKKRVAACLLRPEPVIKRPDWDNVGKIVSDAINGICWHDDAQVAESLVKKVYGSLEHVDVVVAEMI